MFDVLGALPLEEGGGAKHSPPGETGNMRQETGDRRQETGDRRPETRVKETIAKKDRRHETRDNGHEALPVISAKKHGNLTSPKKTPRELLEHL